MLTMAQVDAMDRASFVAAFGGVFEHSPWVAEHAYDRRPFSSLSGLHEAMADVVRHAPADHRMALIQAHPDLAGKAARAGALTEDSSKEQASAGLDCLSEAEYDRFHALNGSYRAKFGIPFIMAVRGAGKNEILDAFERRLPNGPETEIATAIEEIVRIGHFRLTDMISG
jgi:2-oxo-4-hydroxy-4-carboxy-5-ureidoimidazoline decarboxylase